MMSLLTKLFRCACLCVVFERGSWNPQQKTATGRKRQAAKRRLDEVEDGQRDDAERPEWLKEWTISKGWVHNRSHLLHLGREGMADEESSDGSTVSNVDELISIGNVYEERAEDSRVTPEEQPNYPDYSEITIAEDEPAREIVADHKESTDSRDISIIFQEISQNYRQKFPENRPNYKGFQLPEIYKEKLLKNQEEQNLFMEIWKHVKLKRRKKNSYNCKFTINKLYDEVEFSGANMHYKKIDTFKLKRNSYGRNIAMHNTLNSKTNLHEDPIYECSEESVCNNSLGYIYYNPVYSAIKPSESNNVCDIYERGDHNYRVYPRKEIALRYDSNSGLPLRTEKYVIRHVRIRIMLSMRLGKMQKVNKRARRLLWRKNADGNNKIAENDGLEVDTQNQSTRRGRLDVLRWLLWEQPGGGTRQRRDCAGAAAAASMPALRQGAPEAGAGAGAHADADGGAAPGGGTLALHYAAARGCLDCVRLLVDSTPELSANTQMDNDVTPVYLAAQEGHLDVLKFLVLEAGGSLYVRAKDGMAPIHAASQMGCLNCVKWMIQEQGVDPNLRDGDGATPLHFAASRGHLETVRWLLKHGARLSLDKYGKSPINDAAENQQVECLNVLVQHGTSPDYQQDTVKSSSRKKSCSCTRRNSDQSKRGKNEGSDCSSCKSRSLNSNMEPFYLHPPINGRSIEAAHAPENGLYINPMNSHRHSISSCSERSFNGNIGGESFYLHNPQEVIYNRVKDLFESSNTTASNTLSGLTGPSPILVKVEVHSTSSGAGSDENLSCSDLSERSADHDHDYEDIYIVREESKNQERSVCRSRSRDSGSHSRSGSISSTHSGCNVVVKLTKSNKTETTQISEHYETTNKANESNFLNGNEEQHKMKLEMRRSLPVNNNVNNSVNTKVLKRVISVPAEASPPPPPPPPPLVSNPSFTRTPEDDEPRGAEIVEIVEEPTLKPSEIVKGMCRSMSALTSRRLNASCSDLASASLVDDLDRHGGGGGGPNLVNKQRVLPFVPPSFPGNGANSNNHLIKPSEYLRSISVGDKRGGRQEADAAGVVEEAREVRVAVPGPPPPPLPEFAPEDQGSSKMFAMEKNSDEMSKSQQPLSAISIQDLNSVQLRRTDKMVASKTFSAPTRSMSLQCLNQAEAYVTQKTDLIAELKMSKDITGIKKMKIEKAKTEEYKEKEFYTEISRQFTATNFVDKVPDKDNSGNLIPAWKRQMLAKKAAEKAKKDLEEQLLREAEEKRLQAIPPWKRQLLAKKEEAENKIKSTLYTPKVTDETKVKKIHGSKENLLENESPKSEDINNNDIQAMNETNKETNENHVSDDESTTIIPWRAQLRKTNSKLNLLD